MLFGFQIKEVNITNFLGISRELSASIVRFQNNRVFFWDLQQSRPSRKNVINTHHFEER